MADNTKNVVTTVRKGSGRREVFFSNGVSMGEFLVGDDGYWSWWPDRNRGGCIDGYVLRALADELDSLNAEWDKIVQEAML